MVFGSVTVLFVLVVGGGVKLLRVQDERDTGGFRCCKGFDDPGVFGGCQGAVQVWRE